MTQEISLDVPPVAELFINKLGAKLLMFPIKPNKKYPPLIRYSFIRFGSSVSTASLFMLFTG